MPKSLLRLTLEVLRHLWSGAKRKKVPERHDPYLQEADTHIRSMVHGVGGGRKDRCLSLIHISEPTRPY